MRVIVNGDDLGYTMGVTRGILAGYKEGILRSTTALMNAKYIEESAELAKECPDLGVGLHLNLSLGAPLTEAKTLRDPSTGLFYKGRGEIWKHNPSFEEVGQEWEAQLQKFKEVFGCMPDHLDSHHSVHDAVPQAKEISLRMSREYNLPLRRYNHFQYVPDFFGASKPEDLIHIFEKYGGKDIEIMAHPAFVDLDLYLWSSVSLSRIKELAVLCAPEVKSYVKDHHIEITNYRDAYANSI